MRVFVLTYGIVLHKTVAFTIRACDFTEAIDMLDDVVEHHFEEFDCKLDEASGESPQLHSIEELDENEVDQAELERCETALTKWAESDAVSM